MKAPSAAQPYDRQPIGKVELVTKLQMTRDLEKRSSINCATKMLGVVEDQPTGSPLMRLNSVIMPRPESGRNCSADSWSAIKAAPWMQ